MRAAQRAHEIGVRIALGADARRINELVLGSSLRLTVLGAALGIGGAIAVSRWTHAQVFGVKATDPATIAMVATAVVATVLAATWQPDRHATRIDSKILLEGLSEPRIANCEPRITEAAFSRCRAAASAR